jgi:hypothetical protein
VKRLALTMRSVLSALRVFVTSAFVWLAVLAFSGAAVLVIGIHDLAGVGWAEVVAGLFLLGASSIVWKGMNV